MIICIGILNISIHAQESKKILHEKLYVHTDKNFYLAGEIMWFKVYYVDGTFNKPLDLSKIAYIEILDRTNKSVMQAKTALKKGSGDGSFYLPSSVNSGNYKIRAYTSWMKNFDADFYFEKNITIVNSLKTLGNQAATPAMKYDAQFMPEGGDLVNGIESRIAFKVNDQYGKGVNFSGQLVNTNGDTILNFAPSKFGMGSFLFRPDKDQTYKAVIKLTDDQIVTRELPRAIAQGYVMRVTDAGNDNLQVSIASTNQVSADLIVFASTRGAAKAAEKVKLTNGTASVSIDKKKLGEGVSTISILNERQQPLCERLYFKAPVATLAVKASSDAKRYTTRKKIDLSIEAKASTNNTSPANMSLSVYRLDSLQFSDEDNILSYFWLSSDLKGTIESPGYYFANSNGNEVKEATDNLMLTQGWRRFGDPSLFEYAAEFDGHIITGRITKGNNQPMGFIKTYLSVPGIQLQFHPSISDEEGRIHFDVRDYYGQNEIVVQTEMLKDSNYRVDIANPFSERYSSRQSSPFKINESVQQSLRHGSINMQTLNAFAADSLRRFDIPGIDSTPFYGKKARKYFLDDYVRFTTIEEVLREYVPEVGIRRTDGQMRLRVADWNQLRYLDGEPLILLDGVPVTHAQILAYDPIKVRKLEVVTNRYISGRFVFDGIVSFTSYTGNMEELRLDPKTIILDYEGLQLKREFYSPAYTTEEQRTSRMPDFRTLLYWSPDIKTDRSGNAKAEFYTSDIKGKYLVVLQGMDESGNMGSYYYDFEVN